MNNYDQILGDEMEGMLCGRLLGSGESRTVYECNFDKNVVIKVQNKDKRCNHMEYEVYCNAMGTHHEDHFAKVIRISETGRILAMERTYPPGPDYKWPIWVPQYMADLKKENFGLVMRNGECKLVAHDYANHNLFGYGFTKKFVKARWWSVHDRSTWDVS